MINRSVLIVRAKEPFRKWLKSLPDPIDISLDDLNEDSSAYLLPEYESDDEQDEIMAHFFKPIFEEQLDSWWANESDWPADRNLALFSKWFQVEFPSMVIDLVDSPLED